MTTFPLFLCDTFAGATSTPLFFRWHICRYWCAFTSWSVWWFACTTECLVDWVHSQPGPLCGLVPYRGVHIKVWCFAYVTECLVDWVYSHPNTFCGLVPYRSVRVKVWCFTCMTECLVVWVYSQPSTLCGLVPCRYYLSLIFLFWVFSF